MIEIAYIKMILTFRWLPRLISFQNRNLAESLERMGSDSARWFVHVRPAVLFISLCEKKKDEAK